MNQTAHDLRYALRQLRKAPGFTLTVVLTLAIGIGANTAIFSAVYAFLVRSLPYPNASRVAAIEDVDHKGQSSGLTGAPRFFDLQAQVKSDAHSPIEQTAFYIYEDPVLRTETHAPEVMLAVAGSGQFFPILGSQPLLGRVFGERDNAPDAPMVVVLSYPTWQRSFGGDPGVIGRRILLSDRAATIIGVMPRDFAYPYRGIDLWKPAQFTANDWHGYRGDGVRFLNVLALMRPGIELKKLQPALDVLAARLAKHYPSTDADWSFTVHSLRDDLYGAFKPALLALLALLALMAAAVCVLLIACVNIANLLLSRAATRQREVALRRSLGATGVRIARQSMTESLLLSLAGGALGILLASALLRLLPAHLSANMFL